jgi:hypothetical protein
MTASKIPSAADMGTVDLLLGLLAKVAVRVKDEHQQSKVHIPVGELSNALHELQQRPEFQEELQYLDFDRLGNSSYSESLENFLFQGGTWWQHQVPNPAIASISVDESQAKKRLDTIKSQYGDEGVLRVNRLADAFLKIWPGDSLEVKPS